MSQSRLAIFLDACDILRRLEPTASHGAVTPMPTMTRHRRFPAQWRYHIAHAWGACTPSSEVPRRIQVGVDLETASLAFEEGMLRPVATLGVATAGAALRRVLRVFLDDLHIDQCRLVPDEVHPRRAQPRPPRWGPGHTWCGSVGRRVAGPGRRTGGGTPSRSGPWPGVQPPRVRGPGRGWERFAPIPS